MYIKAKEFYYYENTKLKMVNFKNIKTFSWAAKYAIYKYWWQVVKAAKYRATKSLAPAEKLIIWLPVLIGLV